MVLSLEGYDVYYHLRLVVARAQADLVLVFPFPSLSPELCQEIVCAQSRGVRVVLITRRGGETDETVKSLFGERPDRVHTLDGLHARMVISEKEVLVTSANPGRANPYEVGHLVNRAEPEYRAWRLELDRLIEASVPFDAARVGYSHPTSISQAIEELVRRESAQSHGAIARYFSELVEMIERRFDAVDGSIQSLHGKVDEVRKWLSVVVSDFDAIKKGHRPFDEKVALMCSRLDTLERKLPTRELESEYSSIIAAWLERSELLEDLSRTFLVIAEYLFDSIARLEAPDFSPFVLQYCRALEWELLLKLFAPYRDLVATDPARKARIQSDRYRRKENRLFLQYLDAAASGYTLGQMHKTLSRLGQESELLGESDLLQDFREFASQRFAGTLFEAGFLRRLDAIVTEFRNKAAHPHLCALADAKAGQVLLRGCLNELLLDCR